MLTIYVSQNFRSEYARAALLEKQSKFRDITWNVEENMRLWNIPRSITFPRLHFMLYCGKSISFGTVWALAIIVSTMWSCSMIKMLVLVALSHVVCDNTEDLFCICYWHVVALSRCSANIACPALEKDCGSMEQPLNCTFTEQVLKYLTPS